MPVHDWNATLYDQKHAFVFGYGKNVLAQLEPRANETILDLGCGTGHLTWEIAQAGARVVGIDSSPSMIKQARQTYPDLEFLVADARSFTFPYQFDAVFSNATLHWILEPEKVVASVEQALKPGGRFVAEFGGKGNIATIVQAVQQACEEITHARIESGWYFPSLGEYASLLERHGLTVRSAALFERPTRLDDGERGLNNWLQMFGGERMLAHLTETQQIQIRERACELARAKLFQDGNWYGDYVRLRVEAYKSN